eukprot:jgi/Mesen1/9014/ME000565S08343
MADTVQYLLEEMVPEVEDLEKRGLFTRVEIKQIVKARTNFEYRLKRRATLKEDFQRYVEYEIKLEALRKFRKKALVRELKASKLRWRSSLSDRAITRRVIFIYERAVRKFRGDLRLWLKYMEFCREHGGTRQMQKVITKALQLHPATPGLWIYAAAWEFEHNANVVAARALMQRGLRMCPKAELLWLEYFRMELTYAQKLKARRIILGLSSNAPASAQSQGSGVQYLEAGDESAGFKDGNSLAPEDELSVKIARAIYKSAVAAVPQSPGFRHRFVQLLQAVDFDGVESVEDDVYSSLAADFPSDPESWKVRAGRALAGRQRQRQGQRRGGAAAAGRSHADALRDAIQVFNEALSSGAPGPETRRLYADFLEGQLGLGEEPEPSGSGTSPAHSRDRAEAQGLVREALLAIFKEARDSGVAREAMGRHHLAFLLRCGAWQEAAEVAAQLCEQDSCSDADVVQLCVAVDLEGGGSEKDHAGGGFDRALDALQRADIDAGDASWLPVWATALQLGPAQEGRRGQLVALAEKALQGTGGDSKRVACALVTWLLQSLGLQAARTAYNRLLLVPGVSVTVQLHCAAVELRAALGGDLEALERMRKIFEAAVDAHGAADAQLWLQYCRHELAVGNVEAASNIHWRAKKMLASPGSFVEQYQQLVSN